MQQQTASDVAGSDELSPACSGPGACYLFGPEEAWKLMPAANPFGLDAGGWFQFGYHNRTTPLSTTRGDLGAFNDVPHALNLHQAWVYVEKAAKPDQRPFDWGFRFDVLYGTDAQKTQAYGGLGWDTGWDHGVYGWAIPQLYFEVAYDKLKVKMGHFYTLAGYEVVQAPDNFFYSHALTMFNTEPFTHSGVLLTYAPREGLQLHGGWTAGWDTGFESFNDGNVFLGGFSYSPAEAATFTYITTVGDLGARGSDSYFHSIVLDLNLTDKLEYVLQSDLLLVDSTNEDDVGLNQYVFYTINECLKVGGRFEWWKNDGVDNYEITGGVNLRPHANVVFRPELRWDDRPEQHFDQTTFAVDMILTY